MDFTSINHALTQAINNLAEGEIDVAALAMAEDIEKEELDEAKRTKKEQQRIDGRSLQEIRHEMAKDPQWRSDRSYSQGGKSLPVPQAFSRVCRKKSFLGKPKRQWQP